MTTGGAPAPDHPRPLRTETVVADHARYNRTAYRLAPTLLRSRSVSGRAILAHVASGGLVSAEEMETLAHREDRDRIVRALEPRSAGAYARVLAHQPGTGGEDAAAADLLGALVTAYGPESVVRRDLNLYGQLLAVLRRDKELERLLESGQGRPDGTGMTRDVEAALMADLANPFLGRDADESSFLEQFNAAIDPGATTAPVTLRPDAGTPFDRLAATRFDPVAGPLITVVTSAYNPDHALLGAARSLISQTWTNWEMLVVDDASTEPSARALLRDVERLDPRIRVVRKTVNGGTYRARNTALMQARGAFMTFLDSDDWAHPQRLEEGVRPMLERPRTMATRSHGVRVTESLELTRPGYRTFFSTAAALMFRLPEVPSRIGFFDPIRKAADTEYSLRIEAAFGQPIHEVKNRALTVVRRAEGTLSAADFSFGWQHQSRWAYKQAYRYTHRQIEEGADPFTDPHEPTRHYGAHRWARPGDPEDRLNRHIDVVLAGDWRRLGGPQLSMLEEITALRAAGLRVGVMHMEAMRFRTEKDDPLCPPLRALLRAGEVELIFHDDDVEIGLLLVRYPPVLQFPPVVSGAVRPRKLFVMANQAPCELDGSDQRYVPADVHRNARELFGVEPRWIPQSVTIRHLLQPLLPAGALASWDNPAVIDPANWSTSRLRPRTDRPVIGRFSRDASIKFPRSREDLLAAYGFPAPAEVRFLGAAEQVARLLDDHPVPENWTVLPHGSQDPREFVRDLDVVVYMDDPEAHEAFGRVLLEAAASGVLVVASPKHAPVFGDALVYAEPEEVQGVVTSHLRDHTRFQRQVETSLRRVRERWSHETFLGHVRAELADAASGEVATHVPNPVAEATITRVGQAVTVETSSDDVAALVLPLRRLADAESADHLVVLHSPALAEVALRLGNDVRSRHVPGEALPDALSLPNGVCAVVLSSGPDWYTQIAPGGRVDTADRVCRLSFDD